MSDTARANEPNMDPENMNGLTEAERRSAEEFFERIGSGEALKAVPLSFADFLQELLAAFRRLYVLPVILSIVFCAILCIRARADFNPIYCAKATFAVNVTNSGARTGASYSVSLAKQLSETFPYIFSSDVLNNLIRQDLDLEEIPATIMAEPVGETNLFEISVYSRTPQMSYQVLRSAIENYPRVADFVIGNTTLSLISEPVIPEESTNTISYSRELVKGVLFGIVASLAVMVVSTLTKSTVRDSDDLKSMLNLRCLGNVPYTARKKRAEKRSVEISSPDVSKNFADSVRLVRTRTLRVCEEMGYRSILVTSSMPGEGKTTVASNLAMSAAMTGKRVALLDCDIRKPSDLNDLVSGNTAGIAEYLNGKASLEEIISNPEENLFVINSMAPSDEAAELLGTARMKELLSELLGMVDLIIIDSPPASVIADAVVLSNIADCILYVIRQEYTRKSRILDGLNHLANGRAPFLGYVLNSSDSSGGYGAYGRYSRYGRYARYGRYGSYSRYGRYGRYGSYSRYGRSGSYAGRYGSYSRYGGYKRK